MDSGQFNLNLLRALAALLEERNVTRAAERLGLSQPAVSASLAQLRVFLGDPLLVRRGNELVPSARALAIQPKVRQILDDVNDVLQGDPEFDPSRDIRRFRVAAKDYEAAALVVPFALHARSCYAKISVDVVPLDGEIDDKLAAGTWDIAVAEDFILGDWPQREELYSDELVIVARGNHPRLGAHPDLNAFLAEEHVRLSPRPVDIVDAALKSIGGKRVVAISVPNFWQALQVVAQTDMIASLPARLAAQSTHCTTLQLLPHPLKTRSYRVVMAWHRRSDSDQAIQWLKAELGRFVPLAAG